MTVCFIQAYYLNRTVIFKDIDPNIIKETKGKLKIKLPADLNRFNNSFEQFSNCSSDKDDEIVDFFKGYNYYNRYFHSLKF